MLSKLILFLAVSGVAVQAQNPPAAAAAAAAAAAPAPAPAGAAVAAAPAPAEVSSVTTSATTSSSSTLTTSILTSSSTTTSSATTTTATSSTPAPPGAAGTSSTTTSTNTGTDDGSGDSPFLFQQKTVYMAAPQTTPMFPFEQYMAYSASRIASATGAVTYAAWCASVLSNPWLAMNMTANFGAHSTDTATASTNTSSTATATSTPATVTVDTVMANLPSCPAQTCFVTVEPSAIIKACPTNTDLPNGTPTVLVTSCATQGWPATSAACTIVQFVGGLMSSSSVVASTTWSGIIPSATFVMDGALAQELSAGNQMAAAAEYSGIAGSSGMKFGSGAASSRIDAMFTTMFCVFGAASALAFML